MFFGFQLTLGLMMVFYGYSVMKNPRVWGDKGSSAVKAEHFEEYCRQNGLFFLKAGCVVAVIGATFPIIEDGRNAMFSGAFVQLAWPGADFAPATVKAGETGSLSLPRQQMELVERLGELIPGSLYLKAGGETLTLLLRGRFLGFRVNPLVQIS